jgi:murein L,D-transpeptidase YafK
MRDEGCLYLGIAKRWSRALTGKHVKRAKKAGETSRWRNLLLAGVAALALAGCQEELSRTSANRGQIQLSQAVQSELAAKGMSKTSPILMRIFKQEAELEVWKMTNAGNYELFKTYPICKWSGELGPKVREGDRQAPEGFYTITQSNMNPNSNYFLSFNIGFPNKFDAAYGRSGSHLMVHGDCSSRGCYAMTDANIGEIYAMARESLNAGQSGFQVQAYPFRMTGKNIARHRNNPNMAFWKNLKEGNDHFLVAKAEPKVDVCEKRYVFNAVAPDAGPREMIQSSNAWGNIGRGGTTSSGTVTTSVAPAGSPLVSPRATVATPSGLSSPAVSRPAVVSSRPLSFSASDKCPAYVVPSSIAQAVAQKAQEDHQEFTQYASVEPAPIRTGLDGGSHETFGVISARANPEAVAAVYGRPAEPAASPVMAYAQPQQMPQQQVVAAPPPARGKPVPVQTARAAAPVQMQAPAVAQAPVVAPPVAEAPSSPGLFAASTGWMKRMIGNDQNEPVSAAPPSASAPVPQPRRG